MSEFVLYEKKDRLAYITLNRPDKNNAMNPTVLNQLRELLTQAEEDGDVRVIIIRGAGRNFCAGYDLEGYDLAALRQAQGRAGKDAAAVSDVAPRVELLRKRHLELPRGTMLFIWDLMKPVISQVQGYALAGGSELAFMCDLTYVAEDARMGYPPVRAFSTPDTPYHMWFAGIKRAKQLVFTGDAITGIEAVQMGLANAAFPADQLASEVEKIALRIANVESDLLALQKGLVNRSAEIMGFRTAIDVSGFVHDLCPHLPGTKHFFNLIETEGLPAALQWRDGPFGDYTARKKTEKQ